MADQANDEILQLARQGSLQALSVYLNRHLIPYGAHVKLKNKEDALSILIVTMRESENPELIQTAQNLLTQLRPAKIQRVKIYSQVLGQKQAVLKQKFTLIDTDPSKQSRPNYTLQPKSSYPTAERSATAAPSKRLNTDSGSAKPLATNGSRQKRFSVAEFLSQATNIKDLKALHSHPFVTGICPQCRYQFKDMSSPPTYWDCPRCGWQDNLSAIMPQATISTNSVQTSLVESKRLGDYLIEAGLLTSSQIEVALADQITTGLRFGEVLVRRSWVKEETIEYLMEKIIIPERTGLNQNAPAFLASSRNLLKALIEEQESEQPSTQSPLTSNSSPLPSQTSTQPTVSPTAIPFSRSNASPNKLPSERETLILPDLDISEHLKDA